MIRTEDLLNMYHVRYRCSNLSIYLSMSLQPFVGPWTLFQFLDLFTQSVGLLGRGISPSQGRYLHTEQHRHRINAHRRPRLKWNSNPLSQCFERAKAVHTSDRAATVIGAVPTYLVKLTWSITATCMLCLHFFRLAQKKCATI
jgi:hypothetical protein